MAEEREASPPATTNAPITFVCSECGEIIEIRDPIALIRSIHLQNACEVTRPVVGGEG